MKYLLIFLVIAVGLFFYTKNLKHYIDEITPENYNIVLGRPTDKFDLKNSNYGLRTLFIRSVSLFEEAHNLQNVNSENYKVENSYTSQGSSGVRIYDKIAGYRYFMNYYDRKLIGMNVQPNFLINNDGSLNILPGAQDIVNDIIKEYGYVYKKSNSKQNIDLIIKELNNYYIVGVIGMDNFQNITTIDFSVFNRGKYFN